MINPTRTDRPLHQQMASQLTGASAFMKDGVSSRYISDIYKLDEKVNQAYNSFNAELKEGNGESAARIYKQNYGYLQVRDAVVQLLQDIRETNALARYVDKAKDISPEDRRKLITDLRMKQNDIARITYSVRKIAREQQAQADKLSLEELLQSKP
jgi:murein L,D-transpeptidase YcbB/YkuD